MGIPVQFKVFVFLGALTSTAAINANGDKQDDFSTRVQLTVPEEIKKGVVFQLYTRKNRETPEILNVFDMAQNKTQKYFDRKNPVRICVHGWASNGRRMALVRKAFLDTGDYNIIMMNWKKLDNVYYPVIRKKVESIGKWLAHFLDLLVDMYDLKVSNFHLVGHSLGAHITGNAGRYTQRGTFGRITGLDPAGVLFKRAPDRLTFNAAAFVDVIHTCSNIVGYREPLGHADFYPNGGVCIQPGCLWDATNTMAFKLAPCTWKERLFKTSAIYSGFSCSHNRAMDFFTESITSEIGFRSWPFAGGPQGDFETNADWAFMGNPTDTRTRGVYYVETSGRSPFAIPPPFSLRVTKFTREEEEIKPYNPF